MSKVIPTSATETPSSVTTSSDVPSVRVAVEVPADLAAQLGARHSLPLSDVITRVFLAYANAPVDPRGTITLTREQFGQICECLSKSPQSGDELVAEIEKLVSISIGGVRIKLTQWQLDVLNGRNATGLPAREWAKVVFDEMFDAWVNGKI